MSLEGKRVVVIGGCGHVGLPLGVTFALAGAETVLIDVNQDAVNKVREGKFPFLERGGDEKLQQALARGLKAEASPEACEAADVVVFVTGTPVDEHLNPKVTDVTSIVEEYQHYLKPDSLIVMRSTLFPGTMEHLYNRLKQAKAPFHLAFCPERVSQGYALEEIDTLPQIVSAFEDQCFERAYQVFRHIAPEIIRLSPLEAEMTKLMANSWRYLEFAIANQFYLIAEQKGVDFYKVYQAIKHDYPRAKGYKAPGFAAGPCLFKDTMQLASYFDHQFYLGHSAMLVNENLAGFVADRLEETLGGNLWGKTVGLLGMAFKANNDDTRESLSFRVRKALLFKGAEVIFHDPYVEGGVPLSQLERESEGMILCTPHREYLDFSSAKPIIDVWGVMDQPALEVLPGFKQPS